MSAVQFAPDLIASIRLYATEKGGRDGPTPSDKLGFLFGVDGEWFDCWMLLQTVGALAPGSSAKVPLVFLNRHLLKNIISVGSRFEIRDGKVVGEGVVEEIMSLEKKPPRKSE